MADDFELIKHREISFRGPHVDMHQAQSAILLLSDVEGVVSVNLLDSRRVSISYDIRQLTLQEIDQALREVGFHIDNNLLYKLKFALYAYTEAVQRANLGLTPEECSGNCAQKIFVQHYRKRAHGCRDERPAHWRQYL